MPHPDSTTPILPGFHPDPSICRVDDDYFVITSTFEYLPGVPIFHSRDLVRWRLIGNVLDREDQLSLPSSEGSGGIFAPTLRFHDGRFWMITTNINRVGEGHLIVSATDPAGPWTTPVYATGAVGIDPDLFWDTDGTCYLTWASGRPGSPISQAVVNPETGELLSERTDVWGGTGLAHPEGPHLYRRGDWYYLLLAEGGTERGHAVTVARSRSVRGPYEGDPANPILSHRSTSHPVQNTGHADLVERADGSWAMVHLGVRPVGPSPSFHVNGRETFIAGVRWLDDWPVVDETAFDVPKSHTDFDDDFSSPHLDSRWIAPGRHPHEFIEAAVDVGCVIRPSDSTGHRSLLAIRVEDQEWDARATVDADGGRLVLRLDDSHWVAVGSQDGAISVRMVVGPLDQVLAGVPAPDAPKVTLAIRATLPAAEPYGRVAAADDLTLGYVAEDEFRALATVDGRYLSTEVAAGFTGRVIGVEPTGTTDAVLRRFSYRGL
ncbi:glycoside hydrolase family 43 protein [Microbacterium pumilum]|uniref:Glycoside hydrolase family 43 protein n=1 Tax=Microbacterium pumilum TaxID=344165 RepID=A0ABP5DLR8_9MICO